MHDNNNSPPENSWADDEPQTPAQSPVIGLKHQAVWFSFAGVIIILIAVGLVLRLTILHSGIDKGAKLKQQVVVAYHNPLEMVHIGRQSAAQSQTLSNVIRHQIQAQPRTSMTITGQGDTEADMAVYQFDQPHDYVSESADNTLLTVISGYDVWTRPQLLYSCMEHSRVQYAPSVDNNPYVPLLGDIYTPLTAHGTSAVLSRQGNNYLITSSSNRYDRWVLNQQFLPITAQLNRYTRLIFTYPAQIAQLFPSKKCPPDGDDVHFH